MSPQLLNLLALLPEDKHDQFVQRLPRDVAQAIAGGEAVEAATLQAVAEAVWACLEA
jgi:hypothetical protein